MNYIDCNQNSKPDPQTPINVKVGGFDVICYGCGKKLEFWLNDLLYCYNCNKNHYKVINGD